MSHAAVRCARPRFPRHSRERRRRDARRGGYCIAAIVPPGASARAEFFVRTQPAGTDPPVTTPLPGASRSTAEHPDRAPWRQRQPQDHDLLRRRRDLDAGGVEVRQRAAPQLPVEAAVVAVVGRRQGGQREVAEQGGKARQHRARVAAALVLRRGRHGLDVGGTKRCEVGRAQLVLDPGRMADQFAVEPGQHVHRRRQPFEERREVLLVRVRTQREQFLAHGAADRVARNDAQVERPAGCGAGIGGQGGGIPRSRRVPPRRRFYGDGRRIRR